jgi:hypothetical protein
MIGFCFFKNSKTAFTLLFLTTILLFSCTRVETEKPPTGVPAYSKVLTQGPVNVTMQLSSTAITIAEQLELNLYASIPEEYEMEMPSHKTTLGDFSVNDVHSSPTRLSGSADNTRLVVHKTFILEPYLPGTYTIPALKISYREKGEGKEKKELFTEEVEITVSSFLPGASKGLQIKDIKGPEELPPDTTRLLLMTGLLVTFVIVAGGAYAYWRKTHAQKEEVIIQASPDEIAFQELDTLLAEDLLARGEVKLFHLRISDILRRYIENRFGLKAPERTTEEFLAELSQNYQLQKALLTNHKRLLEEFLSQCDLVKFAKHEPSIEESGKTFVICREFVEETKEKDEDKG